MLTEKDAWTVLTGVWSTPQPDGTVRMDGGLALGLCDSVTMLLWGGHINRCVANRMKSRIKKQGRRMGLSAGNYLWPKNAEGAKARAEFCKTQATRRSLWDWFLCR